MEMKLSEEITKEYPDYFSVISNDSKCTEFNKTGKVPGNADIKSNADKSDVSGVQNYGNEAVGCLDGKEGDCFWRNYDNASFESAILHTDEESNLSNELRNNSLGSASCDESEDSVHQAEQTYHSSLDMFLFTCISELTFHIPMVHPTNIDVKNMFISFIEKVSFIVVVIY